MSRNKITKRVSIELDWTDANELKENMRILTQKILEGNESYEHLDRRKAYPVIFQFMQWYLSERDFVEQKKEGLILHTVKSRL
jgi:intein/homing endonuclease